MTRWIRVCLAISGVLLVAAGARRMHAQTAPKIAWDESSGTTVNGYALTIDGVRTDYKLSPLSTTGTCGCSLPLPFSGGRHTLVVSAYNASGEVASSPLTVAPIAVPGGPYTGQVGTAITVNGSGSNHPAGTIVGYTWSWGDGTKTAQLTTSSASHTYSTAGTFQITLTVTDNAAATASATTTAAISTSTQPTSASTVVLWAGNTPTSNVHGAWSRLTDSTAAGNVALWNPNAGAAKVSPALASPTTYFEQTFHASAGVPYHLWVRLRAQDNSLSNDSVHVQFNDSTDVNHTSTLRIGSTSSAEIVLQNGPNATSVHGWGWSDNGWGSLGSEIYFASTGAHTVRVQTREDGAIVDQIVLSPDTYLFSSPGAHTDDVKVLQYTEGTPQTLNTSVTWTSDLPASNIHGTKWQRVSDSSAAGGSALWNPDAGAPKIAPALANPASYFEAAFSAKAGVAYHVWVRMRAQNNSVSNDSIHAQFNDAIDSNNAPFARIGTTNSAEFVLQNGPNGSRPHGWGWTDNGWGSLGRNVFFSTTGTHTIRIQQREDGAVVDQIVISADAYLKVAPGTRTNDTVIVGK